MGKVIQFPKENFRRVKSLQRFEARRLFLSLSILSLVAIAMFISEGLNNKNRPIYILAGSPEARQIASRQIASDNSDLENGLFNTVEEVQTGYKILNRLNSNNRAPSAILGTSPTLRDRLQFELLSGKYKLDESSDSAYQISFVGTNDVSDRPLYLNDRENFLKTFGSVLNVDHTQIKLNSKSSLNETFDLMDRQGKKVGRAEFQFDDQGRFTSLKVQKE